MSNIVIKQLVLQNSNRLYIILNFKAAMG